MSQRDDFENVNRQKLVTTSHSTRVSQAAHAIDLAGQPGIGGCNQAVYDAQYVTANGYYPDDTEHLIAVELDDEKWLHSMTISAAVECRKQDLMANSFYLDEFPGYHDAPAVEGDVVFHIVDASWLCDRPGGGDGD